MQAKGAKIGPKTRFFCDFLKCCSLVFLEITCNDSLKQFLTSRSGKIHEKIFRRPNLGQKGPKLGAKMVFGHFLKFGSIVFLEIAYNDSLQQCIISSRGKTHEKNFWIQIWAKQAKIGSKISFFVIFSSLVHQFCCKLHRMIAWNDV